MRLRSRSTNVRSAQLSNRRTVGFLHILIHYDENNQIILY